MNMPQDEQILDGGQVTSGETDTADTEAVDTPTTEESTQTGQAEPVADAGDFNPTEYAVKKGWKLDDPNTASEIIKSYYNLEKKLGNWNEVEALANEYKELSPQMIDWQQKAKQWDDAQEYLNKLDQKQQLEQADLSKAPAKTLADAWRNGQLSLGDLPKERQYEVQRYVQAEDAANEARIDHQAKSIADEFPIIKENQQVADLIATKIEQGVTDPRTGRELEPREIAAQVVNLFRDIEKRGEERIKKDQAMIKEGNLETTGSVARTIPTHKVKSVREAFEFAKQQHE